MTIFKRIILLLIVTLAVSPSMAQTNGSNSSYSRFGLGLMNDQSQGFNRGMAGVAQGIRSGQKVNMLNPASYSAIDSLTFIFDAGMGLQYGHLSQGGTSVNVRNTSLEYVNAGFRITKGLGMSLGFVPFSTIGYNFTADNLVGNSATSDKTITTKTTYYGNGGLHQMYLGLGWNPFAKLSIGANISYIWGTYNHSLSQTFYEGGTSSSDYNTPNVEWTGDIRTYKLDIGAQYPIRLSHQDWLTLGATVSLGHGIKNNVQMLRYTSKGDSVTYTAKNAFDLPYTISAGASYSHQGRITVAADYTMERWDGCKVPTANATGGDADIAIRTDQYINRHRISVGGEYIQNPLSRKYGDRIHYRIGVNYSTPYLKINSMGAPEGGYDGPKEYGVTAGVALPLTNKSKSLLNVSLQWLQRNPMNSSLIKENYVMMHLGITFNEAWFMKWKFN